MSVMTAGDAYEHRASSAAARAAPTEVPFEGKTEFYELHRIPPSDEKFTVPQTMKSKKKNRHMCSRASHTRDPERPASHLDTT